MKGWILARILSRIPARILARILALFLVYILHNDNTHAKSSGGCSHWSKMASGAKKTRGFTCRVPGCFNNNKPNRDISFLNFPKAKSWKKWLKKFQEKTLNRQTLIRHRKVERAMFQQYFHSQKHIKRWKQSLEERSSMSTHQGGWLLPSPLTEPARQLLKVVRS